MRNIAIILIWVGFIATVHGIPDDGQLITARSSWLRAGLASIGVGILLLVI